MAISVSNISQSEFINLCKGTRRDLARILSLMSDRQKIEFYRDIQIALTHFAKGKPVLNPNSGDVMNADNFAHVIQLRALSLLHHVEKDVGDAYMRVIRPMIARKYPNWTFQKVKSESKRKWQKFIQKFSY